MNRFVPYLLSFKKLIDAESEKLHFEEHGVCMLSIKKGLTKKGSFHNINMIFALFILGHFTG